VSSNFFVILTTNRPESRGLYFRWKWIFSPFGNWHFFIKKKLISPTIAVDSLNYSSLDIKMIWESPYRFHRCEHYKPSVFMVFTRSKRVLSIGQVLTWKYYGHSTIKSWMKNMILFALLPYLLPNSQSVTVEQLKNGYIRYIR
jgi:hypothetical protein